MADTAFRKESSGTKAAGRLISQGDPQERIPDWARAAARCPLCRGSLEWQAPAVRCLGCGAAYPRAVSVPNFTADPVMARLCAEGLPVAAQDAWQAAILPLVQWRRRKCEHANALPPFEEKRTAAHRLSSAAVLRYLALRTYAAGRRVLDVGCGTAFRAHQFPNSPYLGVDASIATNTHSAPLIQAFAERLPLHDGAFDLALCIDVLDHVIMPEWALEELVRATAPGGRIFVLVGDASNKTYQRHKAQRAMFGVAEASAHLHEIDAGTLEGWLARECDVEIELDNGFVLANACKH